MKTIKEIPFHLPSKIYRGFMPESKQETHDYINKYLSLGVKCVVLLATDVECTKSKVNLKKAYVDAGIRVLDFPIMDKGVPDQKVLKHKIRRILHEVSRSDSNMVMHCSKSIGRTGLVLACLAHKVFKYECKEALAWTRKLITGAVENEKQENAVREFIARSKKENDKENQIIIEVGAEIPVMVFILGYSPEELTKSGHQNFIKMLEQLHDAEGEVVFF